VVTATLSWFEHAARELPWREPGTTPWGVLVSEFMLQQTPVSRVVDPWQQWMSRWPTADDLASEASGSAVAAWGRLGYPRRALRLHGAAVVIAERHSGQVPRDMSALMALPGVGRYTAAAVISFAHGGREAVLDTNVRRVLARIDDGDAFPPNTATAAEWRRAERWLPEDPGRAAQWAAASMELGAIICTTQQPLCEECPVKQHCKWFAAGRPEHQGPPRRRQLWHGTDRQARGVLLDVVRHSSDPVDLEELLSHWPERTQAERALTGLIEDTLLHLDDQQLRL